MSADDPADLASNSNESSRMSMRRLGSFKNQDTLQRVSIVSSHSSERIFKPGGTTASVISLGHWNGQRWRQRNLERAEERTWWNKVFGARKREGGAAAETNQQIPYIKAIHPESPFRFFWILITTIILLYTLFWTPFSVAFYWSLDACQTLPTLKFDVFVDVWFAVDLILNFVTGTMNLTDLGYEDRLSVVAPKYITSGSFFFDLITTTPVGLIEFILMLECDPNEAAGEKN